MPLDRRANRLLAILAATHREDAPRETADDRRHSLRALAAAVDRPPDPSVATDTYLFQGPGGAETAVRVFAPAGADDRMLPGIVFFHGGGLVAGGFDTHAGLCARLAGSGDCRVLAVDYRLAPEHPFPAALLDGLAATRWVADNAASLGVDPAQLAVGGDSAGGALAAAVCQLIRGYGGPAIALQILICPILDFGAESDSRQAFAEGFFVSRETIERDLADYCPPDVDRRHPHVSPLRATCFAGLPPTLIHAAEFDPFRDEAAAFAAALRDAGVPVREVRHPGMIHYFYAMGRAIPYALDAAEAIGADIRMMLNGPGAQRRTSPAPMRWNMAISSRL